MKNNKVFKLEDLRYGNVIETSNGSLWIFTGDTNSLLNLRKPITLKLNESLLNNWVSIIYKDFKMETILFEHEPKLNNISLIICDSFRKSGCYGIVRKDTGVCFLNSQEEIKTNLLGFNDLIFNKIYRLDDLLKTFDEVQ